MLPQHRSPPAQRSPCCSFPLTPHSCVLAIQPRSYSSRATPDGKSQRSRRATGTGEQRNHGNIHSQRNSDLLVLSKELSLVQHEELLRKGTAEDLVPTEIWKKNEIRK